MIFAYKNKTFAVNFNTLASWYEFDIACKIKALKNDKQKKAICQMILQNKNTVIELLQKNDNELNEIISKIDAIKIDIDRYKTKHIKVPFNFID